MSLIWNYISFLLWMGDTKLCVHPTIVSKTIKFTLEFMIVSSWSCFLMRWLSLSFTHTFIDMCVYTYTFTLSLFRASYELEMCRRDGVWAGNQYSARYMEVCNLTTLSFSGLSLNRPNQTFQPELMVDNVCSLPITLNIFK